MLIGVTARRRPAVRRALCARRQSARAARATGHQLTSRASRTVAVTINAIVLIALRAARIVQQRHHRRHDERVHQKRIDHDAQEQRGRQTD